MGMRRVVRAGMSPGMSAVVSAGVHSAVRVGVCR
jgi:hypothetical protein